MSERKKKLTAAFYAGTDVVAIARALLGKVLVTDFGDCITAGMITETEAYAGIADKASHAFGNRRTSRTEPMYAEGGTAYVYLCYGLHHLFNVVTNAEGTPHAVLIRAIEPLEGIDCMKERRGKSVLTPALTSGPGSLSAALAIHRSHTGLNLLDDRIWIEDRGIRIPDADIVAGTRVGVAYAKEDALLPYRFWIRGNVFVSKGKGL